MLPSKFCQVLFCFANGCVFSFPFYGEMSEHANGQTSTVGESDPKEDKSDASKGTTGGHHPKSTTPHNDGDIVQLKGKNTFAVPRTVRPLGWTDKSKPKTEGAEEGEDEKPKSNNEFRKMLLKK